jgi:hypothetical protein
VGKYPAVLYCWIRFFLITKEALERNNNAHTVGLHSPDQGSFQIINYFLKLSGSQEQEETFDPCMIKSVNGGA